jgi:hypothetical protein
MRTLNPIPSSLNTRFPASTLSSTAELQEEQAPLVSPERESNEASAARMRDPYFCFELI